MKISRLRLKNIKCFKEVDLSFEDEDGKNIKKWSLVVGDNGQGKTTLLRSIAIGLCDKASASALLADLHGGFLRQGKKKGYIEVTLKDEDGKEFTIKTTITLEDSNIESIRQNQNNLDRRKLFAVAYGAGRAVTGTESYEEYALVDSVYSLFNYEYKLLNAELGVRRIEAEKQGKDVKNLLKEVLMLDDPNDEIGLDKGGLYVNSSKWGRVYFNALSDGYRGLTSVILDFLIWYLLYSEEFDIKKLSGIFIIDEIEQHLHPIWQRKIIKLLADQFPNIQFIGSTHTPICALGASDVKHSQLIKAAYEDENDYSEAKPINLEEDYKGYRYDQILGSDVFGLRGTRSVSIEETLKKYRAIYRKDEDERSDEEKSELKSIKEELKGFPMWDDEKDRETRREFVELLKKIKKLNDKD